MLALDESLHRPRRLTPEARLVIAMIEDAFLNVKDRSDHYYHESRDFLLDRNGSLSAWLAHLSVDDDYIRQLARIAAEGR